MLMLLELQHPGLAVGRQWASDSVVEPGVGRAPLALEHLGLEIAVGQNSAVGRRQWASALGLSAALPMEQACHTSKAQEEPTECCNGNKFQSEF